MKGLTSVLDPGEVSLLSRVLYDGATQGEIAAADGWAQTTVSYRVRQAVRKLGTVGIAVKTPGRGRRKTNVTVCDPHDMAHLLVTPGDDGRATGRWCKAPKVEQPEWKDKRARGRRRG